MNPETILRKEDCEAPRTAEELIAWIESVHAQFEATDATRTYARLGKGLVKPFYEEIVPLGDLALHKYLEKPNFYLRPKIGNQNYDAEIILKSSNHEHIKRIEFTSTYRNADLALRLEYLNQHGGVFMSGPVWRDEGRTRCQEPLSTATGISERSMLFPERDTVPGTGCNQLPTSCAFLHPLLK